MDFSVITIGQVQNVLSAMQKNLECPIWYVGDNISIVNFLEVWFFVSHFFENALSVTRKQRDLCLGVNTLMFCKAQIRKCKKKLIICSYVLVNFAFLLKPGYVSPLFSEGEKNLSDWIRVLFVKPCGFLSLVSER